MLPGLVYSFRNDPQFRPTAASGANRAEDRDRVPGTLILRPGAAGEWTSSFEPVTHESSNMAPKGKTASAASL